MVIPQPAWALMIAFLGVYCATIGYVCPGTPVAQQAMFTIANSLISGALGALFAGHNANSSTSSGPNATINNPGSSFPDSK
jgi:hypothetical protein